MRTAIGLVQHTLFEPNDCHRFASVQQIPLDVVSTLSALFSSAIQLLVR